MAVGERRIAGKRQRKARSRAGGRPRLSVVVVAFNLPRELPRTLHSLSAAYQKHIAADDYEVIVVDNGSDPAVDTSLIESLEGNFRLLRIDPAPPSPAAAVNRGIAEARGEVIGVMIDGARIATPGLLHFALHGAGLYRNAVVTTLGWYLGHDFQRQAIAAGYDAAGEDALLATINWPNDGYRLFEIGTLDESSVEGWFRPVSESNALFLRRGLWRRLGGMEERFASPGGGFVNLDAYRRAMDMPKARAVLLLGEGTFHQVHGGVATNAPVEEISVRSAAWKAEYQAIRDIPWEKPTRSKPPTMLGMIPGPVLSHFVRSAVAPLSKRVDRTLGKGFDVGLWGVPRPVTGGAEVAPLLNLAHRELRAGNLAGATGVAREVRRRWPDEAEALRILRLAPAAADSALGEAGYHAAVGDALRLAGDEHAAERAYRAAIDLDEKGVRGHVGLALLRLHGALYRWWLTRFYGGPEVRVVIEIGVGDGASLACVPPGRLAIGVDPSLEMRASFAAEVHLFPETSDAFFARSGPDALLAGKPVDVAFIDGNHVFDQALRDFINVERYCAPTSIVLIHDTVPLDEPTQRPARARPFYTGDIWKLVVCLRALRPDLDVFTIATPYSGLTVVAGLDPNSRILSDTYTDAVARFADTPYASVEGDLQSVLAMVPNAWDVVAPRLRERGISVALGDPITDAAGGTPIA